MDEKNQKSSEWESLTTAEQVVAAQEAGRRVWNRPGKRYRWLETENRGINNIRSFIAMGWEYRAVVKEGAGHD